MADLTIVRGDDYRVIISLATDGVPFDLTDYTVAAQIRPTTAAGAPLTAEFTATVDPDPTTGVITLVLTHDVTELLTTSGVWDMQITGPAPDEWVTTIVSGVVTIVPDVTRIEP